MWKFHSALCCLVSRNEWGESWRRKRRREQLPPLLCHPECRSADWLLHNAPTNHLLRTDTAGLEGDAWKTSVKQNWDVGWCNLNPRGELLFLSFFLSAILSFHNPKIRGVLTVGAAGTHSIKNVQVAAHYTVPFCSRFHTEMVVAFFLWPFYWRLLPPAVGKYQTRSILHWGNKNRPPMCNTQPEHFFSVPITTDQPFWLMLLYLSPPFPQWMWLKLHHWDLAKIAFIVHTMTTTLPQEVEQMVRW